MTNPDNLFGNFFDSDRISDSRARRFTLDAIPRLTAANNANQYDTIIADLNTKAGDIGNALDQMLIDIAQQKGATYSVDQIMEAFLDEVRYKKGMVRDIYRTDESAYLEFYPQELKDYNKANKTTVKGLMVRYAAAATAHAADFDPSFVSLFQNFPGAFTTAQTNQSTEMEDVGTGRSIINTHRQDLNQMLYKAVHFVAYYVGGNIDAIHGLFRFNLLFAHGHNIAHEKYNGVLLPNTTAVAIHDTFPEGTKIKVRNFGSMELKIATKSNDDPTGVTWTILKAGKTKTYTKETLFSNPDDTYILVHNADLNDHLAWQMERWVEEDE